LGKLENAKREEYKKMSKKIPSKCFEGIFFGFYTFTHPAPSIVVSFLKSISKSCFDTYS